MLLADDCSEATYKQLVLALAKQYQVPVWKVEKVEAVLYVLGRDPWRLDRIVQVLEPAEEDQGQKVLIIGRQGLRHRGLREREKPH